MTASSIEIVTSGLAIDLQRRWLQLRERLERDAIESHPSLEPAFKALRLVSYPQRDAKRKANDIDLVIVLHAATLAHIWDRVLRLSRVGGVYRSRLEQVKEAQRAGNAELARSLFDQLTRGQALEHLEQRPALLLLRAVIRFQCQMRQAAMQDLDALQKSARTILAAQPHLRILVHHLLGVCCLETGQARRATKLLKDTAETASKTHNDEAAAYAMIDLALAQADLGEHGILGDTITQLSNQLPLLFTHLSPEAIARLRRHLCKFAGSRNFQLINALSKLAFVKDTVTRDTADTVSDLQLPDGTSSMIDVFSGMLTMMDQQVDLSGVCDELFSVEGSQDLGLVEHPLARIGRLGLPIDDSYAPMVAHIVFQTLTKPQIAEAALQGGTSFCMAMRLMGKPDMALYANVCLEYLSRRFDQAPTRRVAIALQRGYLLLKFRRLADAATCFEFALHFARHTHQSFSSESSQAWLGLGLCAHFSGHHAIARIDIWSAYAIARIAPRSEAQGWRSAFALSTMLNANVDDVDEDEAGLRREAALLLDKVSIQQMLDGFVRDPEAYMPGSAEWFPSMRQALDSLVALGRIVEAEAVREVVRAANVDELTSANPIQRAQIDASVLSERENLAWTEAMRDVECDVEEIRNLIAPHGAGVVLAPATIRQRQRRITEIWTSLPGRLDQALLDAARRLKSIEASADASSGMLLAEPAGANVPLPAGEALIGYLVHPKQLFITLRLPDGSRSAANVAVGAKELRRAVMGLRSVCADAAKPMEAVYEEGLRVYRLLVEPIRATLEEAGITSIGVAPHEFLDLVPFAALWDGTHFMAECFAWSLRHPTLTDAEAQTAIHFNSLEMALLGATDFDDEHIALPGVALELHRIGMDVGPRARTWTGRDLTAQALLETLSDTAVGIVHVATHAFFDPRDDSKSYLELGHGERLGLPEIRERLRRSLPLLVLAACSTGARGPVRDSIASSFIRCGAQHVLATQWQIHDASSSWLMPLFYRQLNQGQQSPAQALQAAQRSFIDGSAVYARWDDAELAFTRLSLAELRHPRWWAPFTLFR